jgi:5-methylthioadenosine/S-adenosylhomocysteine deaminase
MATQGGARAVMLHDEIGTLEPGKKADIILLNINRLHLSPTADLPKTVVLNGGPDDVSDVIVDGKVLIENGAFREFDVGEIRRKAGEALLRVGKKADLALPKVYIG